MQTRVLGLLSAAHLTDDLYQGILPAMLPFMIDERGYSYATAAALVLAMNLTSSVAQPLFGALSDRRPAPWLVPVGMFTAGLGVSLAGIAPGFALTFALIATSGIGVAAFHPEGARNANLASGDRRATGVSIFASGGSAGFALGPVVATPLLLWLGLRGSPLLALPVVVVAAVLALHYPRLSALQRAASARRRGSGADQWGAFSRLSVVVVCRSAVFYAFNTFVPLYWVDELGRSKAEGATVLTAMLVSGVIAALVGGRLADRYGRRVVVVTSMAALTPLLTAFVATSNVVLATLLIVPIGFALYAPFSVMTVMGQEYLPNRIGLASGLTLGVAVTAGGLLAPVLGRVGDHAGLHAALITVAGVPLLATLAAFSLHDPGKRRSDRQADEDRPPAPSPTALVGSETSPGR